MKPPKRPLEPQKWTRVSPTRAGHYYLKWPGREPKLVEVCVFTSLGASVRSGLGPRLGIGDGGGEEPRWMDYYRANACRWLRVPTVAELLGGGQ